MKQTLSNIFPFLLFIIFVTISCNNQSEKSYPAAHENESNASTTMTQDSLTNFGKNYAAAWTSKNPNDLASFFANDGILLDGSGKSAVGRDSIAYVSKIFHDEIPDIIVNLDSMVNSSKGIKFYWTLTGTNTRGIKIKMNGVEVMELKNGLISKSQGSYTDEQYDRIVKEASK